MEGLDVRWGEEVEEGELGVGSKHAEAAALL